MSLFSYTNFLRIQGKSELNHWLSILASILVLILIVVLASIKLGEVARKEKIVFQSTSSLVLEPPITVLSTYMDGSQGRPFMLAVQTINDYSSCPASDQKLNFTLHQEITRGYQHDPNTYTETHNISLEPCTSQHFSLVPGLKEKFSEAGISGLSCLPLNKTYEIGGSKRFSSIFKNLRMRFQCLSSCNGKQCGRANLIQLNSRVDPNNQEKPFQYFLSETPIQVSAQTFFQYVQTIEENILTTDRSSSEKTISLNSFETTYSELSESQYIKAYTALYINRGIVTNNMERSYSKYLDAVSYVGGVIPFLLALFFFLAFFNSYFFDLTFSKHYFRDVGTKDYGLRSYFKERCFAVLTFFGFDTKWEQAKHHSELRKAVGKLLDISSLCRRVEFLERVISITINQHQLKGLLLMRVPTLQQTQDSLKRQRFRDRMVTFLHFRLNQRADLNSKEDIEMKDKKESVLGGSKAEKSAKSFSPMKLMKRMTSEGSIGYKGVSKRRKSKNMKDLSQEAGAIVEMEEEELNQEELLDQLRSDLRRLMEEANKIGGDPLSKKILDGMDSWLRDQLREAIVEETESRGEPTLLGQILDQ